MRKEKEIYTINNKSLKNLLDSFVSKEITSCNLSDYNIENFLLFSQNFEKNNLSLKKLESELIKKNIYFIA